jgi:peroxiredoxin
LLTGRNGISLKQLVSVSLVCYEENSAMKKKKDTKVVPYIVVMILGAGLIVATAWIGLFMPDDRIIEEPYTETTRDVQSTGGYRIKSIAENFSLKNIDNHQVSLSQFASEKGVIIVFTCNHCPFAKAYEDRILALNTKFSPQGFPLIAINPTNPVAYEEDSFEKMKQRATSKKYTFPYLADDNQVVARKFGATKTPHVFILRNDNGQFIVEYMGGIDDNPQDPSGVNRRYAEEAVNNLLAGKPVGTTTTKAIGCVIKWKDI